jgi:predicted membrane protein
MENLEKLVISLTGKDFGAEEIENFCELYLPIFSRIIIVDSFFGSCSIFVPFHIDVDIQSICGTGSA